MKQASKLFTEADRTAVAQAVEAAEHTTAGEIVPVVASASGRYDRAEDLFGVVCALGLLSVAWLALQDVERGAWAAEGLALGLPAVLATILIGFVTGATLASRFPRLKLPFLQRSEMQAEVERSAREAFQRFRVRGTAGATGILLYVSLEEQMVTVLGDDAIAAKLPETAWQEVVDLVTAGLARGDHAGGLAAGIARCGQLLAEHFPAADDDVDELANELHLVD